MSSVNNNLETILRSVRSKAAINLEEQHLIRELLQIIYNRQNFGSDICQTTFAAVFLRQSGLEVDDRLAFEEYNSYRNRKALKYRPHIRLVIKRLRIIAENLDKIWPNSDPNEDNVLELTIITYLNDNRKQKRKIKYKNKVLRQGIDLQIDSQTIHPLRERSEDIWISLSLSRYSNKYHKYLLSLCQTNKIFSKAICVEGLKGMPLTGHQSKLQATFGTFRSSEGLLQTELEVKVEFTDDPKNNLKFRTEKLNSHKSLVNKVYNRWSTDTIPSQMKALIEMNRQQNGITSEESYVLEENVLQDIQELSEANRKRKEFFSLINRAPTPQSNDFNDDNKNNNSSGFVPPIQDKKVFDIINKKKIKLYSE